MILRSGLLIGRGEKCQISRDFYGQIRWKIGQFRGKFQGKLRQKAIGKKRPILWLFSRQISLEIDRFCADQTIVTSNRGYRLLFQQQYAQEMNQWQSL